MRATWEGRPIVGKRQQRLDVKAVRSELDVYKDWRA
jgi:hypothetical protein